MMSKILFTFFLAGFINLSLFAQYDNALVSRLNNMFEVTIKNDFDKILDLTCPELFTLGSKEDVKAALQEAFANEGMEMKINSAVLDSIYPVFLHDNKKFTVVKYKMNMRMKFTQPQDSLFWSFIGPMMDGQFGAKSTTVLPQENALDIKTTSRLVATKKDDQTDWCFLNYDTSKGMIAIIFDSELINKIESYK